MHSTTAGSAKYRSTLLPFHQKWIAASFSKDRHEGTTGLNTAQSYGLYAMAFGSKHGGLALGQYSSVKLGNYTRSQARIGHRQTKTNSFCVSFIPSCMLSSLFSKKSSDLSIPEQNLPFDHIQVTQFSKWAQWSIADIREIVGGKDQRGNK